MVIFVVNSCFTTGWLLELVDKASHQQVKLITVKVSIVQHEAQEYL